MRGNALAAVEDFDRARRDACPNLLAQQLVRQRVVVLLDLDVVVEPDPAFLPFGEDVGLGRQRLELPTVPDPRTARDGSRPDGATRDC